MGTKDRFITVDKNGVITLHEENDGWSFASSGPERQSEVVKLEKLKEYPHLFNEAIKKLKKLGIKI